MNLNHLKGTGCNSFKMENKRTWHFQIKKLDECIYKYCSSIGKVAYAQNLRKTAREKHSVLDHLYKSSLNAIHWLDCSALTSSKHTWAGRCHHSPIAITYFHSCCYRTSLCRSSSKLHLLVPVTAVHSKWLPAMLCTPPATILEWFGPLIKKEFQLYKNLDAQLQFCIPFCTVNFEDKKKLLWQGIYFEKLDTRAL